MGTDLVAYRCGHRDDTGMFFGTAVLAVQKSADHLQAFTTLCVTSNAIHCQAV